MNTFLFFGYPDAQEVLKGYEPQVQLYYLQARIAYFHREYFIELACFIFVWFVRAYWLLMVLYFFIHQPSPSLQLLSIPILFASLAMVYALGIIMRSASWLHIFFAVVGVLIAGVMM